MSIFSGIINSFKGASQTYKGEMALEVISDWRKEVAIAKSGRDHTVDILPAIEGRLSRMTTQIGALDKEIATYKKDYTETKDLDEKRHAARRMIYSVETKKYLTESREAMQANLAKSKEAAEDAAAIIRLTQQKIEDAELYFALNKQIVMTGKMVSAGKRVDERATDIKSDFGSTLTDFETYISKLDANDIIAQAEEIIKNV